MKKNYIDLSNLSEQFGCKFEDVEVAPGHVIRPAASFFPAMRRIISAAPPVHRSTKSEIGLRVHGRTPCRTAEGRVQA